MTSVIDEIVINAKVINCKESTDFMEYKANIPESLKKKRIPLYSMKQYLTFSE
jgi:hypothetical protein